MVFKYFVNLLKPLVTKQLYTIIHINKKTIKGINIEKITINTVTIEMKNPKNPNNIKNKNINKNINPTPPQYSGSSSS